MPAPIDIVDGRILLRTHFKHKNRCKSVGARWDARHRVWWLSATPVAAAAVIDEFSDYTKGHALQKMAAPLLLPSTEALDKPIPYTVSTQEPWRPQREAFWFTFERFGAASSGGVLLDMAMGTGKSRVIIDLVQNMRARNVLVFAPKSAVAVWPFQVLRWAVTPSNWMVTVLGDTKPPDEEEPLPERWVFEHRSIAQRVKTHQKSLAANSAMACRVTVVNWESCWREPMSSMLLGTKWDLVVGDEIHRIKAARGNTSLFASKLEQAADTALYRVGMSGTVMPHSPEDAFGVMRFVDRSLFGLGVTVFRNTYLFINPYIAKGVPTKNPKRKDWFVDDKSRAEFERRYGSVTYRAEKDIDNLPPLVSEYRWADLEPKAKAHYVELLDDMYTEIRRFSAGMGEHDAIEAFVTSPNAMVLTTRLQQLVCGFLVDEEGIHHDVSKAKEKLLEDVLKDIDPEERVVVFARFVEDLDRIQQAVEKAGRTYGEVSGRRKDVRGQWRESQPYNVLGVQVASGSVGVDYTICCYSIFWSVWGGGDFAQARDRIHRPPQKRPVTQIALVTKPIHGATAVDYRLMKSLYENEDVLRSIARSAVRAAWKKRS